MKVFKHDYTEALKVLEHRKQMLERELEFLEKMLSDVKAKLSSSEETDGLLKEYRDLHKEYRNTTEALARLEKQIQKYKDMSAEATNINVDNVL